MSYAEEKKKIIQKAEETLLSMFSNTELLYRYLDIESRIDDSEGYSVRDTVIIADQYPHITELHTVLEWNEAGKFLQKGEKGIVLPDFESESNKFLFDISQTKDYKKEPITEDPPTKEPSRNELRALLANNQTRLATTENPERTHGKPVYYDSERNVIIAMKGISPLELYQGLATELAHAEFARTQKDYTRQSYDTPSQMSRYLICKQNHIATGTVSIDESLKDLPVDEVQTKLEAVRNITDNIQNEIGYYIVHGNDRLKRYVPHFTVSSEEVKKEDPDRKNAKEPVDTKEKLTLLKKEIKEAAAYSPQTITNKNNQGKNFRDPEQTRGAAK